MLPSNAVTCRSGASRCGIGAASRFADVDPLVGQGRAGMSPERGLESIEYHVGQRNSIIVLLLRNVRRIVLGDFHNGEKDTAVPVKLAPAHSPLLPLFSWMLSAVCVTEACVSRPLERNPSCRD